jgi:hypothetical protein
MIAAFLQHRWKAFRRSKNSGQSLAVQIILGVLILYFLLNLLVVSFFLDKILLSAFPSQKVMQSFNSILLYYFIADLFARFQLQELPTLSIRSYLHLPIKKRWIAGFLSFSSLGTGFNFAPFVLTLPFLIKVLYPTDKGSFVGIVLAIIGIAMFNHFFSLWLKRKVGQNFNFIFGFLLIIAIVAILDYYLKYISISSLSAEVFNRIITDPSYCLLLILPAVLMFAINWKFLMNNLYLEELQTDSNLKKRVVDVPFLNRFGMAGELAALEIKLIFRNKRPKSVVMMSLLFMFYGLIFYTNPKYESYSWTIFVGMFITGIFIVNYGQFMFSWQTSHFDGILANKISPTDFFRSKFILLTLFTSIIFLLTIPYVYYGWNVLFVHFMMFLWNVGVNSVIVLFFANRNYKRIDLSKGGSFNWEGVGATQWLLSIPFFIGPYLFFIPLNLLGYAQEGILLIGFIGLTFIVSRQFWLKKLVEKFSQQRYLIAEGFRNP